MTTETITRDERLDALDQFAQMAPETVNPSLPVPVPPPSALQVVGAQAVAVRRDEQVVLQRLKVLAAAAGEHWYYRFPVKNRKTGRTDWIEGPSIKLANDLARVYGNCEVDCRAQDMGSVFLFHARFLDLETGFALTRPFQQRKSAAKIGGDDEGRRDEMALAIGASKASRNVIVNALQTYADFAFEEARQALVGRIGSDLQNWRERVAKRLAGKVDIKRVEAVIGRSFGEMLAPDVAKVIAMGKACEDGMSSWDETFPPLRGEAQAEGEALDRFADERSMVQGQDAGAGDSNAPEQTAGASLSASPPHDSRASAVDDQAAASRARQMSAIDICIRLANNPQLTEQEKLEQLDNIGPSLDGCSEEFIKTVTKTAADVARGKSKPADARDYLRSKVK